MTKVVSFIEIDVPICANSFGVSPCTATPPQVLQTISSNILSALVGLEPDATIFNESINGRKLGDITGDGSVSLSDGLLLMQYESGIVTSNTYIETVFYPTLLSNPTKYAAYLSGDGYCFNSRKTCKDVAHYTATTATVRFGYPDADDNTGIEYIPSLKSVAYRPQQITIAEDIGVRANLTATFIDHRDSDTYAAGDPYFATRGYNPFEQGTFWGKFRARHPYMQGAILRYVQGIEGQTREAMDVRTFVIDKITGPSLDGKVTITAKDILKLADDDKAQCPKISKGRLTNDLSNSATSLTLSPSGIGNTDYPASGYVTIGGKEICSFTRSGDVMTITRAQFNTTADTHKAADMVQLCKCFFTDAGAGLDPSDIIYDLLVNYTTTPASWITLSDWKQKTGDFIGRLYYAIIPEPTSVRTLLNELIEQCGIILFSDDISQQIRLDVVRETTVADRAFTESDILADSFAVKDQPAKRLSQVWTYYGQRNPLENLDEVQNYSASVAVVDDEAEELNGVPAIKKIYSRWIPRANRPAATDLGYRLLARFREAPREFEFSLFRHQFDSTVNFALAGRYNITAWCLQDATGAQATANVQVTELIPDDDKFTATAQELLWYTYPEEPEQPQTLIFDNDATNVNLRAEYDKSYPAPQTGDTITFIIENDVVIGSTTTSAPAIEVGTWDAGINLVLINNGYIVGKGGNGGNGVVGVMNTTLNGLNGEAGGNAIYTRRAITITNNGIIGGGGGGAGSGSVNSLRLDQLASAGGGGGAGFVVGYGGTQAIVSASVYGTAGTNGSLLYGGNGGIAYGINAGLMFYGGNGGNGGNLGQAGSAGTQSWWFVDQYYYWGTPGAGGAAGKAVDGNSYITWVTLGDIRGARIN